MLNFSCSMSNDVNIWHKRLGHPCPNVIKSIAKTLQYPLLHMNKLHFCDACALSKNHALPFP